MNIKPPHKVKSSSSLHRFLKTNPQKPAAQDHGREAAECMSPSRLQLPATLWMSDVHRVLGSVALSPWRLSFSCGLGPSRAWAPSSPPPPVRAMAVLARAPRVLQICPRRHGLGSVALAPAARRAHAAPGPLVPLSGGPGCPCAPLHTTLKADEGTGVGI